MSISTLSGGLVPVQLWTPLHEVESQALDQLRNTAKLPWCFHHVAVMPDVHYGKGATVGSVVAMKNAVSPAICGVDIGCGMGAVKTNLKASDLPESLKQLRHELERSIPTGYHEHKDAIKRVRTLPLWARFKNLTSKVKDLEGKAMRQCGTLGSGNHFEELCLDTDQNVWFMLHSGSRKIGKTLADIHISIAKKLVHNNGLPDKDLAVFLSGTPEMEQYRHDLFWAQEYALENRKTMLMLFQKAVKQFFPHVEFEEPVLCHHNYISEETHFGEDCSIIRKGAISAQSGQLGIIPGSMGAKSFIVRGLGNPDSFCSASHGAGRRMSRGAARKKFAIQDLIEQTKGIECRKDEAVIDEIPAAYKDIEQVMKNQADLVEIVAELHQVLCVKGD